MALFPLAEMYWKAGFDGKMKTQGYVVMHEIDRTIKNAYALWKPTIQALGPLQRK